jgi:cyanophycinase
VHLVGGGWSDDSGGVYRAFLEEATARAVSGGRSVPRIAVIVVHDGDGLDTFARFDSVLGLAGPCEPVSVLAVEGAEVPQSAFAEVDAILVAGGLTPAYLESLRPRFGEIRRQVADGTPYLGFSAGAAIAAERALVGGWKIGDVEVCAEAAGEELEEVTIEEGIGLLDVTVDVHAAQWGTLGRLCHAVQAEGVEGWAVDEGTALECRDGRPVAVHGVGAAARVQPVGDGAEEVAVRFFAGGAV